MAYFNLATQGNIGFVRTWVVPRALVQVKFTRTWVNQTGPQPTVSTGGSTLPTDGQMYPRTK